MAKKKAPRHKKKRTRRTPEEQIRDLEAQIAQLKAKAAREKRSAGARKRVEPQDVLAYLRDNPASGAADVAEAVGTDTASLRPVLKELVEAKKVKRNGQGRGTRYSAG